MKEDIFFVTSLILETKSIRLQMPDKVIPKTDERMELLF